MTALGRKNVLDHSSVPHDWQFFAKGGANLLLQYHGSGEYFSDKLMRLRRQKCHTRLIRNMEVFKFTEEFRDELGECLIEYQLFDLDSELFTHLKSAFDIVDDYTALVVKNLISSCTLSIELSKHGKLHIEQLDALHASKIVILELKPKWLTLSQSIYCRNCCLAHSRNEKRHFCPLDLVIKSRISKGVSDLMAPIPELVKEKFEQFGISMERILAKYLNTNNNIFQHLQNLQMKYDVPDLSTIETEDDLLDEILRGMSLRDVGLFLRLEVSANHETSVTPTVFDLDPKSPLRLNYWQEVQLQVKALQNDSTLNWPPCNSPGREGTRTQLKIDYK